MTRIYDFDDAASLLGDRMRDVMGGKGANLAVMASELGLPVPPGFTISTGVCREFLAGGWPDGLVDEIRSHVGRIEAAVGRPLGGPGMPLLVSVRSGAPVSMPGMMDTILDLGLNAETTRGLAEATGDALFAEECHTRFVSMYRSVVGVDVVPTDPWEQLHGAVEAVFRSWNSARARSYREHEGIRDDLGTAVNVQAMVFGNLGEGSATGVVFTRDPATGERRLFGDVMFGAQGEDVVSGARAPEPITVLEARMPLVADLLQTYADILERRYRDMCDIEFTIERGKLWMLQTRVGKRSPQAALRIAVDMAQDDTFALSRSEAVERVADLLGHPPMVTEVDATAASVVATGLAASPGVASGVIATTPEGAIEASARGRSVILVRTETSPDDVHGMARAAGILTSTGGLASHAAVVARGWGIPAVVGAGEISVEDGAVSIGGLHLEEGDLLTIDGGTGEVFLGSVAGERQPVPEVATLLAWARDLGWDVVDGAEGGEHMTGGDAGRTDLDPEAVIRVMLIKGFATIDLLAPALLTTSDSLGPVLDAMQEEGIVADAGGMLQLTDPGKDRGNELIAADQERWGVESAVAALDAFLPLDDRMKHVVTAWQMREVEGEQVLNDHSDPEYDAVVLADFAAMHGEAAAWLAPLRVGLPRLEDYSARLDRAAALVSNGEHAYIASPRVDSYHSIWFELHEDLILLADRNRADEVAAGRA